ncbi:MAG: DUF1232 domain-containing protein [Longimicrobiales bacterium]|nr:DUF1232 domain-containing protein [Longimicrobiales bacterium]
MKRFGRGRKKSRKAATRLIPILPRFVGLLARLMTDRRVRLVDKGLVLGVLAYVFIPLDLVPDILGILGWTDDLFLLGLAVRRLVLNAGHDVVRSNWQGSEDGLDRLEDGLEDLGTLLPAPVHGLLKGWSERW